MKSRHKIIIAFAVLTLSVTAWVIINNYNSKTKNKVQPKNTVNVVKSQNNENKSIEKKQKIEDRTFTNKPLIQNDSSIPVLMYHSVTDVKGNEVQIAKEKFKEEMQYLKDKEYTTLTLSELYDFFEKNKPIPQKSVVITFDDGYVDNYTNAYPILKELGFKATIFTITGYVDTLPGYLTSAQLKELDSNGIDIEPHTVNHIQLNKFSYDVQYKELKNSKDYLEKLLGKTVKFVAYPDGEWNQDTIKAVKNIGYTMAFTTAGTWSNKQNGIYTLYRVYISSNFGMDEFNRRMTIENYN